jgi:hypothetical protein
MDDLQDKLSEFIEGYEMWYLSSDEKAEVILKFLSEEYDRTLKEALGDMQL